MSTIINSNQIRQSGDTSHQTLINESQIRASGDTSTETLINANQVASVIPSRYTVVDWVNSTGGAWIDTGVKPDDTIVVRCKFIMKHYDGVAFIGHYENPHSESNTFRFFRSDTTTYLDYGSGDGKNRISGSYVTSKTKIYDMEFGNRYVKDLTTNTVKFSGTTVTFSQKSYTIKLFDTTNYGTCYYFQIEKGGELVRDYVPVYDTVTEKYGLYDKANQNFKLSDGSVDFTGGNDE